MTEQDDRRWIDVVKRMNAGDPVTDEDRSFVDRMRAESIARLDQEKRSLREGDSARARFFRLKDAQLAEMPGNMAAVKRYEDARRAAESAGKEFEKDEDGEALIRGYHLIKCVLVHLKDEENDELALGIATEAFLHMKVHSAAFVPRWL